MLIENAKYEDAIAATRDLDGDNVFRYCEFLSFSVDGGHVDGDFIGCKFESLDWYWGLINCCLFFRSRFTKCIFRGTSFSDCRFVDCEFVNCHFLEDNLGKGCTAEGTRIDGSTAQDCKGEEILFAGVAV